MHLEAPNLPEYGTPPAAARQSGRAGCLRGWGDHIEPVVLLPHRVVLDSGHFKSIQDPDLCFQRGGRRAINLRLRASSSGSSGLGKLVSAALLVENLRHHRS